MTFCPKEASKELGPLDACHRSRQRESLQSLAIQIIHKGGKGEKRNKEFCSGMRRGAASTLYVEVVAKQLMN